MAATEWGVFGDEGCVADGFRSRHEARQEASDHLAWGIEAYVAEICPEHAEQERGNCEECNR